MKYIIANWKANKSIDETNNWISCFLKNDFSKIRNKAMIIICPPFPFIPLINQKIKDCPFIKIGAQDISRFEIGTYTGEVTVKTLSGLVNYTILGHSERRQYFNENDKYLFQKCFLAKKYGIDPLFCVRNEKDALPPEVKFVVYEPAYAISPGTGKGNNQPIEKVLTMRKTLKVNKTFKFIYGGSVNEKNASYYLRNNKINGVLVGGASLDSQRFYKVISCFE